MRAIPPIAQCACGEWVINVSLPPGQRKYWCKACCGFVEAIIACQLPSASLPEEGIDLVAYLSHLERSLTEQALVRAGTHAAAAKLLGLKRTTLVQRLKQAGRTLKREPQHFTRARERRVRGAA